MGVGVGVGWWCKYTRNFRVIAELLKCGAVLDNEPIFLFSSLFQMRIRSLNSLVKLVAKSPADLMLKNSHGATKSIIMGAQASKDWFTCDQKHLC